MFLDDGKLEYDHARLEMKEIYCFFALGIGFNLRFHNLPWGLAFDYSEEYPREAERRLSLVKSEMEEEGVDAAVEAR